MPGQTCSQQLSMIWKRSFTIEILNALNTGTIGEHLDIRFEKHGDDYLEASMPVDQRTIQPMGLLHGGANVTLAETLGSVASILCIPEEQNAHAVGVEINANHLRSARSGRVRGVVTPVRVGRQIHVWQIDIFDDQNRKCCSSRLTTLIVKV